MQPWQTAWVESYDNPWRFATGVLGILPYGVPNPEKKPQLEKWQDQFLKEFCQHARHSVRAGHSVGKGFTIAILALWFPLTHYDAKCVLTANTQNQLRDNNWPEIRKVYQLLPAALADQIQIDEERLYVKAAPEMSFVVRRTASKSNPEALQGIHANHVLYLIDESSGIDDIVFEVAQGSLATAGAMACLFSNPTRTSGFFYDTHHKLRSTWRCWHVSCLDVPRAQGHIQEIADGWGVSSNRYRVRVLGEFPNQDDETVIPLDLVQGSIGRDVQMSNVWPILGLDIARYGDDSTALCLRRGNTILDLREWRNLDGTQVAGRVQQIYRELPNDTKPKEIVIDIIGVGAAVYDILRLDGSPCREAVRGCNVAESTAISETEDRLRDELWFRGRDWFARRDCHIPKAFIDPASTPLIDKLVSELTSPLYSYTSLGKRKVESKKDMKKRGVPSPNLADAFLLSLAGGIYPVDTPHTRRERSQPRSFMSA